MRADDYDKLANKLLPFILSKVRQASSITPALANTDMSAAQIMAAVQSLDGAGSGLDADTLDGVEGAAYIPKALTSAKGDLIIASAANTIINLMFTALEVCVTHKCVWI